MRLAFSEFIPLPAPSVYAYFQTPADDEIIGGNDMSSSTNLPAPGPRRPSLRSRLLAFAAPDLFAEPLVQAQFALELSRNAQLQLAPVPAKAEHLAVLRRATLDRLRLLRRALWVATLSTASALFVCWAALAIW